MQNICLTKILRSAILGCAICATSTHVIASDDAWTLNLHFENDLFADTDLNYTNGVRASWVSPDVTDFLSEQKKTYHWINRINELLEPLHPSLASDETDRVHRNIVISVGQLMFTPKDKQKLTLDSNDRPYAGWLYTGIGYQARTRNKLHSFELNLGVVGPAALARQTQNFIHDARNIERFHGWDNQLQNELGVQLVFERKRRFKPVKGKVFNAIDTDLITHWGGSVGNVATYLNAGAELRAGWPLNSDFGTSTLRPGGDSNNPGKGEPNNRDLQMHVFLASDARLVGRNIFLDGNTFTDSHSVDKKNIVADITVGLSTTYKRWNFSYSHVYRTKEFNGQQRAQKYGSFSVSYSN
jgi:hypothetical protein